MPLLLAGFQHVQRAERITESKIPPEELDQMQLLDAQAFQRTIDDRFDICRTDLAEPRQVRHQLGVHDHPLGGFPAAGPAHLGDEGADHLFHPDIDVRTVKRCDASIEEGLHVRDRGVPVDPTVVAGQLPAALDDP